MTSDEMERTMQFILQQQAQFATQQAQITERQAKLTDAVITITGLLGKLAEAQARTEERLNSFIIFVERYINERRNGQK